MSDFEGFVIRGLLSVWLSRGPEHLTDRILAQYPASVQISDHGTALSWFSNVHWLLEQSRNILLRGKKLVLIGHSFGGTAAIMVAQALAREHRPVHLLVPIDPAYQYTTAVPPNVQHAVGFYQHTPGQLGQGELKEEPGWTSKDWGNNVVDFRRYETHLQIIDDPFVHRTVLNAIRKSLAA